MNTSCPSAVTDQGAETEEAAARVEDGVADRDRDKAEDRDRAVDKDRVAEEAADKVAAETVIANKKSPTLRNTQQHNVALTRRIS